LLGKKGDDLISGFGGRDSLFGGKGADVLRARDGVADLVLNCGKGKRGQAVTRDSVDPDPRRCTGRKHRHRHHHRH
jgi:Ca2+-binding RTX toxin-like protein